MTRRRRSRGGLYKPPRNKWIAKIVSFVSVSDARKSVKKLTNALKRGRLGRLKIGRKRALKIVRAIQYAANRAKASIKNPVYSKAKKKELKEIAEVYKKGAETGWKIYHEKYASVPTKRALRRRR